MVRILDNDWNEWICGMDGTIKFLNKNYLFETPLTELT